MEKSESRDERLKKFEKEKINTPLQLSAAVSRALAEINGINSERQAILKLLAAALSQLRLLLRTFLNNSINAATILGATQQLLALLPVVSLQLGLMNLLTLNVLKRYGLNSPNNTKVVNSIPVLKSVVTGLGTANIKTENKTIYNTKTTNNVKVLLPQTNIAPANINILKPNINIKAPVILFKNQISALIKAQNQQYESSKKKFLDMDLGLRKNADRMMRKIDAASKRFAENMTPENIARASTDSLKVVLMLSVAYFAALAIKPLSKRLDKIYNWFTGNKEGEEGGDGKSFFERMKENIFSDKSDGFVGKIKKFFKDSVSEIKDWLDIFIDDRSKAIDLVGDYGDRWHWYNPTQIITQLPAYIAEMLSALVGGTKGLAAVKTKIESALKLKEGQEEYRDKTGVETDPYTNMYVMNSSLHLMTAGGVYKSSNNATSYKGVHALLNDVRNKARELGYIDVSNQYALLLDKDLDIRTDERYKGTVSEVKFGRIKEYDLWIKLRDSNNSEKAVELFKKFTEELENIWKWKYRSGWYVENSRAEKIKPLPFMKTRYFRVWYFPMSDAEEAKREIRKAWESIKADQKVQEKKEEEMLSDSSFEENSNTKIRLTKKFFEEYKKANNFKDYDLSDENYRNTIKDIALTKVTQSWEKTNPNDPTSLRETYNKKLDSNVTMTDQEEMNKWDLSRKERDDSASSVTDLIKDHAILSAEAGNSFASSILNIGDKAKSMYNSVVRFRTNDNIEKAAPTIKEMVDYLSNSLGITKEAAVGIVANLWAESRLNPTSLGDLTDDKKDYRSIGLAQWHYSDDIINYIKDKYGIELKTKKSTSGETMIDAESGKQLSDLDDWQKSELAQYLLDFLTDSLKKARKNSSYYNLYNNTLLKDLHVTPELAAELFTRLYENPDNKEEKVKDRIALAKEISRFLGIYDETAASRAIQYDMMLKTTGGEEPTIDINPTDTPADILRKLQAEKYLKVSAKINTPKFNYGVVSEEETSEEESENSQESAQETEGISNNNVIVKLGDTTTVVVNNNESPANTYDPTSQIKK